MRGAREGEKNRPLPTSQMSRCIWSLAPRDVINTYREPFFSFPSISSIRTRQVYETRNISQVIKVYKKKKLVIVYNFCEYCIVYTSSISGEIDEDNSIIHNIYFCLSRQGQKLSSALLFILLCIQCMYIQ